MVAFYRYIYNSMFFFSIPTFLVLHTANQDCPETFNMQLAKGAYRSFAPNNKYNAYTSSIPAAAGTTLTSAFFSLDVIILRAKTALQQPVFTDAISPVYIFMH